MAPRCPICGNELRWCRCGMGWNKDKIDASFQLWMVDKFHFHNKKSFLVTKQWEDIAYLLCENLMTIMKYADACTDKKENITNNETMHDYIMTRLENIEGAYSCLYINGTMNEEDFNYFEKNQKAILFILEGEDFKQDGLKDEIMAKNWKDEVIFTDYIDTILKSDFFKRNNIYFTGVGEKLGDKSIRMD